MTEQNGQLPATAAVNRETGEIVPTAQGEGMQIRSWQQMQAEQAAIHEIYKNLLHEGVDYDKPYEGAPKPALLLPGIQKLAQAFRLSMRSKVHDLGDGGRTCVWYRVEVEVIATQTGLVVGYGIGECSSNETKYRWRKAKGQAEYDNTSPNSRRQVTKYKRGGGSWVELQVRANPADVANTVLKMAKKRAMADGINTTLACGGIFEYTPEDMTVEADAPQQSARQASRGPDEPPPWPDEDMPPQHANGQQQQQQARQDPQKANAPRNGRISLQQEANLTEECDRQGISPLDLAVSMELPRIDQIPTGRYNEAFDLIKTLAEGAPPP